MNDAPTDLSTGIELNTDGGNDAYLISDTGLSQSLTATTVEIRFAANNLPLETVLVSFNNPTGDELSIQLDDPSNNLELDFGSGSIVLASAIDYRVALVDGAVHTLSVTWDSTAGNWSVYIDGAHIESGTGLSAGPRWIRPMDGSSSVKSRMLKTAGTIPRSTSPAPSMTFASGTMSALPVRSLSITSNSSM